MNFEYEKSDEPVKIPVAFVTPNGVLIIEASDDYYDNETKTYVIFDPSYKTAIIERADCVTDYDTFDENNKKLFYVGDKITITF